MKILTFIAWILAVSVADDQPIALSFALLAVAGILTYATIKRGGFDDGH